MNFPKMPKNCKGFEKGKIYDFKSYGIVKRGTSHLDLEYEFERIYNCDHEYQVRLKSEFVCYSNHKDSKTIDKILFENGFESRQDFLNYIIYD